MEYQIIELEKHGDERGNLIAIEENKNIPFEIKRVYYMFDTIENVRRGYHAHKELKQLLICVAGSCMIMLDDGKVKEEIVLDRPDKGLILNPGLWREMHDFSEGAVLMVCASEYYDESDYIRDYNDFLEWVKENGR
ncbi:MAG: FdtA/QdtA family cupin domain-containing protein [Lachnospiraceae bacterium]|nr:FdtA/QdtA family cupin domain-containing protein [Lachnospiraceae bacterium]